MVRTKIQVSDPGPSCFIDSIYNGYIALIGAIIHQPLSPNGVHQFVPELVSPLPCSSDLLVTVFFYQRMPFFHWFPRQVHTSIFNALITFVHVGIKAVL